VNVVSVVKDTFFKHFSDRITDYYICIVVKRCFGLVEQDNLTSLKISDEALLVKQFRRLWNMDRSIGKEQFYKQMSVLFYTYSPSSNYSYIIDEKERLKEVLEQEGISDFRPTSEFKEAVEIYKKLTRTASSELLADVKLTIDKVREVLKSIDFSSLEEKDKVSALNTITTVVAKIPKLVKDLSDAEKAVAKEMEDNTKARDSQELTIGDLMD
jgi:nucleotidyltransferase/DNA polymerase involved in DNA repair